MFRRMLVFFFFFDIMYICRFLFYLFLLCPCFFEHGFQKLRDFELGRVEGMPLIIVQVMLMIIEFTVGTFQCLPYHQLNWTTCKSLLVLNLQFTE